MATFSCCIRLEPGQGHVLCVNVVPWSVYLYATSAIQLRFHCCSCIRRRFVSSNIGVDYCHRRSAQLLKKVYWLTYFIYYIWATQLCSFRIFSL